MKNLGYDLKTIKKGIKILTIYISTVLIICACNENDDAPDQPSNIEELPGDVTTLFEEAGNKTQTFTFDAGTGTTVNGKEGGTIYINPFSLIRSDGSLVDEGTEVNATLIELYSAKDMILSNKPTVSNGEPLISGGELFFNISENGEDLQVAPGQAISYIIPDESVLDANGNITTNGMQLFVGEEEEDGTVNWIPVSQDSVPVRPGFGQNENPGYSFQFTGFGWINCDKFYNDPRPKTEIRVNLPSGHGGTNTAVYLVLKEELLVNSAYWIEVDSQYSFASFPVGLEVHIVGVAEIEEDYYYSIQEIVIEEDQVLDLEFTLSTLAEIEDILEDL